jgi:hypothetical protein
MAVDILNENSIFIVNERIAVEETIRRHVTYEVSFSPDLLLIQI